jgi:hypothetical protein
MMLCITSLRANRSSQSNPLYIALLRIEHCLWAITIIIMLSSNALMYHHTVILHIGGSSKHHIELVASKTTLPPLQLAHLEGKKEGRKEAIMPHGFAPSVVSRLIVSSQLAQSLSGIIEYTQRGVIDRYSKQ